MIELSSLVSENQNLYVYNKKIFKRYNIYINICHTKMPIEILYAICCHLHVTHYSHASFVKQGSVISFQLSIRCSWRIQQHVSICREISTQEPTGSLHHNTHFLVKKLIFFLFSFQQFSYLLSGRHYLLDLIRFRNPSPV